MPEDDSGKDRSGQSKRCPTCGNGVLLDVTFREGSPPGEVGEEIQQADTRQVETFSCGHEVFGPSLASSAAGTEDLEVERRDSEDTTEPI